MRLQTALAIILPFFTCGQFPGAINTGGLQYGIDNINNKNPYKAIGDIPTPYGFYRVAASSMSFAAWLRALPLKEDKTVHLYNGSLKRNQSAQFAVIDMPVGNKDLQQCADAIMRVRAEYLFSRQRYSEIDFADNNRTHYNFSHSATQLSRQALDQYLEKVFARCGTLSLSSQLHNRPLADMQPGDVFIRGGSPGHAMMVVDVAENQSGVKIYLLAQSYMPAQEMHIVVNPVNRPLSPWYAADSSFSIETPEWTFSISQLKTWPSVR